MTLLESPPNPAARSGAKLARPADDRKHPDRWRRGALFTVTAALHVLAFGLLATLVIPHHYRVGTQVFGLGLGITAYTLGARHAFDADHIAAIDNTTRKLIADGKRPQSVGLWFALGHSTVVVALAVGIAAGIREATSLTASSDGVRQQFTVISTLASGGFLYLIAALNLAALLGIRRVLKNMLAGHFDEHELTRHLDNRGLLSRILGRLTRSVHRPGQLYPIGVLFGLGFDTATEVALLALAGTGAATGLPWYAIVCVPLLFTAGMTLFDTVDSTFMTVAYRWAFANPVRKVYYNLTITALSITVALGIGSIELVGILHQQLHTTDAVTAAIAGIDLNNAGYIIVALFVTVWACAIGYWRLAGVDNRTLRGSVVDARLGSDTPAARG
jgi:high-affinity nickel-transport protein